MTNNKNSNGAVPPTGPPDTTPGDPLAFAMTNAIIRKVVETHAAPEALHCYLALVDLRAEPLRLLFDLHDNEKVWKEDDHAAALTWRASVILVMREQMAEARANGASEEEVAEEMLFGEEAQWASFPRNRRKPTVGLQSPSRPQSNDVTSKRSQ